MAKHITIKVPGKHPQTGEIATFEQKGLRIEINIGGRSVPRGAYEFLQGQRE
ncbi:MAG: hypothetical protein ACRDC4_15515 [Plesiomonas sp.]